MLQTQPRLICFSYHKSGTSLLLHVMTKVSERLGLSLANHYGLVEQLDLGPDIILLPHSLLRSPLDRPYRAIRLIRDPRDIWISGYLYHLRCDEEWCRNTDLDPTPPIRWPRVDHSMVHLPEDWKRHYLERLGGKSYQQNLLDRSQADGLAFELDGYTGSTFTAMREWALNQVDALDVKLEDVMADFDGAMRSIFDHFGFAAAQSQAALEAARFEDIRRMDDVAIAKRPQIYSRTISKWRDVLSATQIARFEELHGDLIHALGYETVGAVRSVTAHTCKTGDAGIRLSADGSVIHPTNVSHGIYIFVVPSGRRQVVLKSRVVIRDAAPASGPGVDGRSLGVKVSQITIRSDAGHVVLPADDPSLTAGWHDAEQIGLQLWRWTNGSAELPWGGIAGPAVVTVRCETAEEYALDPPPEGCGR